MVIWFYMRNIMLPFCIYHTWNQGQVQGIFDREVFPGYGVTMPIYCYLLSLLVVLHYYWFSIFCRMIYKAVTKGDTEDRQNDTSKTLETEANEKKTK